MSLPRVGPPGQAGPGAASVVLDRPDGRYRPGEPITGHARVQAGSDDHHMVSVDLQLYVHGKVKSVVVLGSEQLYAGPFRAHETKSLPFRLSPPRRLPMHAGHLFSVEPRLALVVRVPSREPKASGVAGVISSLTGIDRAELRGRGYPAAQAPIRVEAERAPLRIALAAGEALDTAHAGEGLVVNGIAFVFGLAVAAAGAALWFGWFGIQHWGAYLAAGLALLLVGGGSLGLVRHGRQWLAGRALGTPSLRLRTSPAVDAPALGIELAFPKAGGTLDGHARLEVVERVTLERGSSTETVEKEAFVWEAPLVPRSERGAIGAAIQLPGASAVERPVNLKTAAIEWRLSLTVRAGAWLRWRRTVTLDVRLEGVPAETMSAKVFELG